MDVCISVSLFLLRSMDSVLNVPYLTSAAAIVVVSIGWWYMTRSKSSVKGNLILKPNPQSLAEYIRDFDRFNRSGSIDGSIGNQTVSDMYCLSTSLGMDVLLALGIHPPAIHQPFFQIRQNCIVFKGFIGEGKGSLPDSKYSDRILTVTWNRENCEDRSICVSYEIKQANRRNIREC